MPPDARLQWRCRRGTRELDFLLTGWLHGEFEKSSDVERQTFLELLDWPDDRLFHLLLAGKSSDNAKVNELAGKIRALSLSFP